ncbi:hypothetical protein VTK26DRAFT_8598 [Humicola hyalothermophila]
MRQRAILRGHFRMKTKLQSTVYTDSLRWESWVEELEISGAFRPMHLSCRCALGSNESRIGQVSTPVSRQAINDSRATSLNIQGP